MFAVITCLEQHDLNLVFWSAVVCLVSVVAAFAAYRRAVPTRGPLKLAWIAAAAMLLGCGVWATHFLAMLAYHKELRIGFDLGLTGLSWLVSMAGLTLGVAGAAYSRDLEERVLSGAIIGGAFALLHFIGVAAMRLPAFIVWDRLVAAEAIGLGVFGSATAFALAGRLDNRTRCLGATVLLTLAILALHYTAMAAVTLVPDARAIYASPFGRVELALGVGALVGLIVLGGLGVIGMDRISSLYTFSSMRTALGCTPSPLAIFDANSRLAFWNNGYAEVISQYELTAARGLSFAAIVAGAVRRGLPEAFSDTADKILNAPELELEVFEAPNGQWFQTHLGQTHDGGFVVLLTDVSEQANARRSAEAAGRAKDEFLANMSHEIRTPLNAVLGMVQVMRCHALDPEQAKRLGMIAEAAHSLNRMLNHVMDLSKIEAGMMKMESNDFDLATLVEKAAADHALDADRKHLRFSIQIDPSALGYWRGDSGKLQKALDVLLSNAVKFTDRGAIEVQAQTSPLGLRIAVTDSGVGVSEEQRTLIFDAFAQADASVTRRFGGAGLGLAVARRKVEFMGGTLTLESVEHAGSTFTIDLPFQRDVGSGRLDEQQTIEPAPGGDPSLIILAAEDNPTNQLVLNAMLEPLGVNLTMTANGREAVEAFQGRHFDLILMDIQMPEMNGMAATSEIRRLEQEGGLARTPIVAVTANVMQEQVDAYLAIGMDGVVAKPIDLSMLLQAMDAALCANAPAVPATAADQVAGAA